MSHADMDTPCILTLLYLNTHVIVMLHVKRCNVHVACIVFPEGYGQTDHITVAFIIQVLRLSHTTIRKLSSGYVVNLASNDVQRFDIVSNNT